MEDWRLLDLGLAKPIIAQTFYEAVAKGVSEGSSPNTLILVQPSNPYVCLGFHQEVEREINMDYCRSMGLPIIRRSQGGGTVYLDSNQIFYQVVADRESEIIPWKVEDFFERFLAVTVYVYQKLGLTAEFKPINDVIVNNRKISGNGASSFGDNTVILVGNLILDIDYISMSNVLNVPSEKFRDKMAKSMKDWVTSLKRELGFIPPVDQIKKLVLDGYKQTLNIQLTKSEITEIEKNAWEREVKPKHLSNDWVFMPELAHKELLEGRIVKIAEGVSVVEVDHKAKKLIRLRAEIAGTKIRDIMISGDFFLMPPEAIFHLESSLKGANLNQDEVLRIIERSYTRNQIQSPGVTPIDFAEAIMKLKKL